MLEIEMEAVSLPDDHKVFKCFPGEGYKFYDPVYRQGIVFLDIRGLEELGPDAGTWSDAALLKIVTDDFADRNAKRKKGTTRKRRSPTIKRNFNSVKGLLNEVKKGDLIVVPPPGYRRDVLIGEITDEPGSVAFAIASENEETFNYAGRRVRWLAAIEKRQLETALLDRLHTSVPFFMIPDALNESVYESAYGSYVKENVFVSTFETTKEHFTSTDNLLASLWFNGFAAVDGMREGAAPLLGSFVDLAVAAADHEARNELELNINSPGTMLVRSVGPFALALAAMLPMSVADAQEVAKGNAKITLRAVGGADPDCALQIEQAVADYVRTLGPELVLQACEYSDKVRDKATLKAKVRLKRSLKRPI